MDQQSKYDTACELVVEPYLAGVDIVAKRLAKLWILSQPVGVKVLNITGFNGLSDDLGLLIQPVL